MAFALRKSCTFVMLKYGNDKPERNFTAVEFKLQGSMTKYLGYLVARSLKILLIHGSYSEFMGERVARTLPFPLHSSSWEEKGQSRTTVLSDLFPWLIYTTRKHESQVYPRHHRPLLGKKKKACFL